MSRMARTNAAAVPGAMYDRIPTEGSRLFDVDQRRSARLVSATGRSIVGNSETPARQIDPSISSKRLSSVENLVFDDSPGNEVVVPRNVALLKVMVLTVGMNSTINVHKTPLEFGKKGRAV